MKSPRESDILSQCRDWLRLTGWLVLRVNSGATVAEHKGKRRFFRFCDTPGVSDLLALKGGVFLGCEIKRPGNKPTAKQLSFLDAVRRHGGMAIVADSVESLARQLGEAGN